MSQPQAESPENVLLIDKVCKAYGNKAVLDSISLSLQPGEIFGLIGLNGVGKTTLIKLILDLSSTDEGSISIFGQPSKEPKARKQLSYLPEKFQPSRYLLGREYLKLSLSYYGKSFDLQAARKMAELLDLNPDALDQQVRSYSKGMGQKLGLAGALLVDQPFLILDEPMSGLDPRARIDLKQQLLEAKNAGKTIFFSSHILSDIDEICDRIAILHDKQIQFIGTPTAFKQTHGEETLERCFLKAINNS